MNIEMEEGEIVDELDDLSDISSEEENLLRQRLEILENYNNVLERKKAKRTRNETGSKCSTLQDTSDISDTDFSSIFERKNKTNQRNNLFQNNDWKDKNKVSIKSRLAQNRNKRKRLNQNVAQRKQLCDTNITNHKLKYKLEKNKNSVKTKTRNVSMKLHSESSDETSNDFKGKKAMLANAVTIQNDKLDKVSLKARLMKMFPNCTEKLKNIPDQSKKLNINVNETIHFNTTNNCEDKLPKRNTCNNYIIDELIDLSVDEESQSKIEDNLVKNFTDVHNLKNIRECEEKHLNQINVDSDEDLDQLRQFALKSKAEKAESVPVINMQSEDEDSDTKELRLICLKSALLKNAMDVKRKERIQKRLSQSSNLGIKTGFSIENDSNNNTDIESVDMDTDSDSNDNDKIDMISSNISEDGFLAQLNDHVNMDCIALGKNNVEAEEDEDLLRAKLLTSLSKKLPKLTIDEGSPSKIRKSTNIVDNKIKTIPHIKESPIIINTNDSDSGSETEAAKNLTKMHNKLIPSDFQKQLDLFLKSTRMEVEKKLLQNRPNSPDNQPKVKEKFVAKPLNHLPKSEQMEYKFLVKRMAELEKIKKARLQYTNSLKNTFASNMIKDTLKPRNISFDNMVPTNLENNITLSRKKIAEESAKMLKLKEEGAKLIQKHKIVATELRNLTTALALNKKQTRIAQVKLTNFQNQHQLLLKRSYIASALNKQKVVSSTQKENACVKPKPLASVDLKKVKVSIVNEIRQDSNMPSISDGVKDKKTVVIDKDKDLSNEMVLYDAVKAGCQKNSINNQNLEKKIQEGVDDAISILKSCTDEKNPETEIHIIVHQNSILPAHSDSKHPSNNVSDYDSPLQSIAPGGWSGDPHGVLCPFEVAGVCKDSSCQFLHTRLPPSTTS